MSPPLNTDPSTSQSAPPLIPRSPSYGYHRNRRPRIALPYVPHSRHLPAHRAEGSSPGALSPDPDAPGPSGYFPPDPIQGPSAFTSTNSSGSSGPSTTASFVEDSASPLVSTPLTSPLAPSDPSSEVSHNRQQTQQFFFSQYFVPSNVQPQLLQYNLHPNPFLNVPRVAAPTAINPLTSPIARDAILNYAQAIYNRSGGAPPNPSASNLLSLPPGLSPFPSRPPSGMSGQPQPISASQLLPLLTTLLMLHPSHIPTLLLHSCVLFALGDYEGSLRASWDILGIEPNFVEAMSNIGTTLRATGRLQEAESWWWKAIQIRPSYWDAIDNFLSTLCSSPSRYTQALQLISFVVSSLPPSNIPKDEIHRLQNIWYTSGNLRFALGNIAEAVNDHVKGVEIILNYRVVLPSEFQTAEAIQIEMKDLIVGTIVLSVLLSFPTSTLALRLSTILSPQPTLLTSPSVLSRIHTTFPVLLQHLHPLPMTFLTPSQAFCLSASLLPSLSHQSAARKSTSTILLTLSKVFQDFPNYSPSFGTGTLGIEGLKLPSSAFILPFHYLSLSLNPGSASTYNNLGILLSSLGNPQLAKLYYLKGLELDAKHVHLWTNLGSLEKDWGRGEEAIRMYAKAIEYKPDFDVALANMGNAMKDTGRAQEAIKYYKRAVQANPDFPEAVCGLINALWGICDWRGRGRMRSSDSAEVGVDEEGGLLVGDSYRGGWLGKLETICEKQLASDTTSSVTDTGEGWVDVLGKDVLEGLVRQGGKHGAGWVIRFVEKMGRVVQWRAFRDAVAGVGGKRYKRPRLPRPLICPPLPSILPFHTFTYPLSPRTIRLIAYRNALKISYQTLNAPWLGEDTYTPPPSPQITRKLNIGYVSSDFNNHPLSHLMQSAFSFHNRTKFNVFLYSLSSSDNSPYRKKIESEAGRGFVDVAGWETKKIVERIVGDGIHILVNLNGYTKGARNDIFAARPCPIQIGFMGYAGTLAAAWCDYLLCDRIVCPPGTSACDHHTMGPKEFSFGLLPDPEDSSENWVYTEKLIYMPHTYFVTDHKQSFREDDEGLDDNAVWAKEEKRRWEMRKEIFPDLPGNVTIFANFNQLYKIDPNIFATWLRILARVPNSILWLLRFPVAGEEHLLRTAELWAGPEIAARVRFTDVARKDIHVRRGRVADLFLDTVECNAHTVAADVLWTGTPVLTWPKHRLKMSSRVCASIVNATGFGSRMITSSLSEYEERAVSLASTLSYTFNADLSERRGEGELIRLRRDIFLNLDRMPLFDTVRWTRNVEKGFEEVWKRWVDGSEFEREERGAIELHDDQPFFPT